ncbi:hypothetical protein CNR22_24080 [Sphingobacteriaceae bacterium]|nr:hypothetical protein CNR22_24080 [Sphingobacteriaceae bacterium]
MFPLFGLAFVAAGGLAVMFLWNAILPPVVSGVGTLTYLQAAGLLILCRILFGGFRRGRTGPGHRGGPPWRQKMMNMSEEEREKFREQWKERCSRK